MPELPEVETIRRDLEEVILNKKIAQIDIRLPRMAKTPLAELVGDAFLSIDRIGKLIMCQFDQSEKTLLIHLKMTGQLIYQQGQKEVAGGHPFIDTSNLPNKYSHIIFTFEDQSKLFFNDMRTFGYMKLIDQNEKERILAKYGPDPMHEMISYNYLQKELSKRRTTIKAFLLNQDIIAGIGNIYADEICFHARVLPDRLVQSISADELKRIHQAIDYIIKLAVKHRGTSFRDYVDSKGEKGGFAMYAKVYKRHGQPCDTCESTIVKSRVAGRGTHYCATCQN